MPAKKNNTKTRVKKTPAKEGGLVVPVYTPTGEKKGTISLAKEVFGQAPDPALLAQVTRVYLANQRSAYPRTKSRGEVSISTRKIYRQKGTGGARHGAKSAPIFVGGGIAHGPKGMAPRLTLPEKMKRLALAQSLSSKAKEGSLFVADFEKIEAKTKRVANLLKKIGLKNGTTIVYEESKELFRAGRNIEGAILVPARQLTAYQVLVSRNVLSTKEGIGALEKRFKGRER